MEKTFDLGQKSRATVWLLIMAMVVRVAVWIFGLH